MRTQFNVVGAARPRLILLIATASLARASESVVAAIVSLGFGHRWKSHDVFGAGISWGRPAAAGLRDQYTAEIFYRFYVTENLFLAPDLQFILDPALNPAEDVIVALGIKARITF